MARLKIRPGVASEPEPFALSEGIVLRGRVVDASGNGIAGARVLAWGNEENAVLSKEGGVFEVPHLAPGPVDLAVTAKGMAMALLTPRVAAGGSPLKIVLSPGGLVHGRLRDRHGGEPLPSIDFFPAAAKHDNVSRWRAPVKDGVFSIRLPPGRYRCACRRASRGQMRPGCCSSQSMAPRSAVGVGRSKKTPVPVSASLAASTVSVAPPRPSAITGAPQA